MLIGSAGSLLTAYGYVSALGRRTNACAKRRAVSKKNVLLTGATVSSEYARVVPCS